MSAKPTPNPAEGAPPVDPAADSRPAPAVAEEKRARVLETGRAFIKRNVDLLLRLAK